MFAAYSSACCSPGCHIIQTVVIATGEEFDKKKITFTMVTDKNHDGASLQLSILVSSRLRTFTVLILEKYKFIAQAVLSGFDTFF